MRTGKIITAVNWRYAFGEVLLIVVGILVALAISDWYDRRIERQNELAMLEEIRAALATDVESLRLKLDETREAMALMERLSVLLSDPRPYEPEMDRLFGVLYGLRVFNQSTSAYETLKSAGMRSVTNRELRALIARIYDYHYQRLNNEHEIESEITLDVLRPYYLRHFTDLRFWHNATPIDPQAVLSDPYFRNLVNYRIVALKSNQLESYPLALADMEAAVEMIDREVTR